MDNKLCEIKQKIITDSEFREWMKQISNVEKEFTLSSDFNNQVALDHGIEHMSRVASNVYKLLKEYNCSREKCYLGYIAGLVHDIGMIYGKKGHAENGANMSKIFLKKFDFINSDDIEIISNLVKNHGTGGENPDVMTSILAIADKSDMCIMRSLGNLSFIKFIENYSMNINDNILHINYIMSDLKGKKGLYMIPKSIDIPKILGNKLGLDVEFYINGKLEKFEDRNEFTGKKYIR